MNFALSNLAFSENIEDASLALFARQGLTGVEIAPAKIVPWENSSQDTFKALRSRLTHSGLQPSSLQAILYGVEGLALLKDDDSFERLDNHIEKVGHVAECLGVTVAVLGSPKQRSRGDMNSEDAFELGAVRLSKIANNAHRFGMCLALEPVPAFYGGDFLQSWQEVQAMVKAVDHPALGIHLDTGCVYLGGGSIVDAIHACKENLVHFQIAEPGLVGFESPVSDHAGAARALYEISYDNWISIEMLEQPGGIAAALQAIDYATETYVLKV